MAVSSDTSTNILWGNVAFLVLTPLALLIAGPWYIATHGVVWQEPVAFAVLFLAVGLGVTAGYHRMFSHKAWDAVAPVPRVLE